MGIITGLYAMLAVILIMDIVGLSLPWIAGMFATGALIHGFVTVWLNYILVAAAVGYSIYCYKKDRQQKIFSHSLILAVLNIIGSIIIQLYSRVLITAA